MTRALSIALLLCLAACQRPAPRHCSLIDYDWCREPVP